MKKILILIIAAILLVVGYVAIKSDDQTANTTIPATTDPITFISDENEFTIQYGSDGETARLDLPGVGNAPYDLKRTESASGTKYTNEDGTVVFWEHQGKAMVEVDGQVVYENATVRESGTTDIDKSSPLLMKSSDGVDQDCDGTDNDCDDSRADIQNADKATPKLYEATIDGDADSDGDGLGDANVSTSSEAESGTTPRDAASGMPSGKR